MSDERRPRVLLADDDETARFLIASLLDAEGFDTLEARSGEETVEVWARHKPDLILLDVEMPGTDGYHACRAIRAEPDGEQVPIVMVTGHDDPDSIEACFEAGATDFIAKPINWSLIGHRVRYGLRSAKQVQHIHRLAYYDSLTGLPNRTLFTERLGKFLEGHSAEAVGVFNIKLNRFKRINDTLGSQVGDLVLKEFARRLTDLPRSRRAFERQHCVASLGGDAFAIFVGDSANRLGAFAGDIRRSLAEPVRLDGHEIVLTASIGIAASPAHGSNPEQLMSHAETACSEARQQGRDTQQFYRASLGEATRRVLDIEIELRNALENGELDVVYQPKFCARTLVPMGAEALVRWHHPQRGEIPPSSFVPVAEESGLITEMGRWLAREVSRQIRRWLNSGVLSGPIAINVSGREFGMGRPFDVLTEAVARENIPASAIEVEITESVLMSDIDSILTSLRQLRDSGFSIAVDDFGTGYSSLKYLQEFPIDVLKIDRSFVQDVETSADSRAICGAIIAMARNLGLRVVAEGVESEWQRNFLEQKSCTLLQGYLLSRPLSRKAFSRHLAKSARQRQQAGDIRLLASFGSD